MKKKILSALVAATLFVGMAVPAFASNVSSLAGDSADVTKIAFTASSYKVRQNDSLKIINDEHPDRTIVRAYIGTKTLVPDADYDFDLDCPDGSFALTDSTVFALEKTGTATLKATSSDNDKIFATTKLVAIAGVSDDSSAAKGFQFVDKTVKVPFEFAGNSAAAATTAAVLSVTVKATPAGATFTSDQQSKLKQEISKEMITGLNNKFALSLGDSDFTSEIKEDGKEFKITMDCSRLTNAKYMAVPSNDRDDKIEVNASIDGFDTKNSEKTVTSRFNMVPAEGKLARNISVPSTITLAVGDWYDLKAAVKAIPSTANILEKDNLTYEEDYLNDDAQYCDYAIANNDGLINAISVGKNKIVTHYSYKAADGVIKKTDATTIVNVVAYGTKITNGSVTPKTAVMKIGDKLKLTAKSTISGDVSWSVSNGKLATVTMKGTTTTVHALKAGKITVTAKVGDSVVGTSTITVTTAKAASTVKKPVIKGATSYVPVTPNPHTGDSFFSNLF